MQYSSFMFQEYLKAGKPPCLVYKLYNFFDRHSIVVLLFKTVNALKMEGEKKKKTTGKNTKTQYYFLAMETDKVKFKTGIRKSN